MDTSKVKRLDGASVRALAHPLRTRLLSALRAYGPATATQLAQRLGESSGATSYHLRQLAAHGFVEENPERGNGRERWWRSAHEVTRFVSSDFLGQPDERESEQWLVSRNLHAQGQWLEAWLQERKGRSAEWLDAATNSDYALHLPPAALHAMTSEIHEVIERYRTSEHASDPDAERVYVLLNAFPLRHIPL